MPDVTQQTFCNASIRNFSCNMGWGNQVSSVTVNLVEDDRNGDAFAIPQVGQPLFFTYGSFSFGGIVQRWVAQGSFEGYPLFQVILNDPRELLDGVQLIVDGYIGVTYSVPNLYNIFGYLENILGYGSSEINESGISWKKIRDAFLVLQNTTPISFRGYTYKINLTQLPDMGDYYRIGGGVNISMMDFINTICSDASCDYFFTLENDLFNNNIVLNTISRRDQPAIGLLSAYISGTTGVSSKEVGMELRNEVTSKFLVGGKTSQIYYNNRINRVETDSEGEAIPITEDDIESQTISQYWGLDSNNNVIVEKIGNFYQESNITLPFVDGVGETITEDIPFVYIPLDTRMLEVGGLAIKEEYRTDAEEMRAVLAGQSSWECFLWSKAAIVGSVHFGKAPVLGLPVNADVEKFAAFVLGAGLDAFKATHPLDYSPLKGKLVKLIADASGTSHEEDLNTLYNYLLNIAQTFYGRQYMVRVPFVLAERDELNRLTTTLEPADAGYVEESLLVDAVSNNYLPVDFFKFETQDGRIEPYVRFKEADFIDVSNLSSDDYALGADFHAKRKQNNAEIISLFVRCSILPNLVFLDRSTLESPRAVLILPAPVYDLTLSADAVEDRPAFDALFKNKIFSILLDRPALVYSYISTRADNPFIDQADYESRDMTVIFAWLIEFYIKVWINRVGYEHLYFGGDGLPLVPDLAAVTLTSNINTYGPWYVTGVGKVEFEQDENLVPWNYGGYSFLNLAANARVEEALSSQLESEAGIIEAPGAPVVNLGGSLIAGGPYLTGIDVSVGENGVKTNYRMETWTQRFGRYSKQNIDRVQKLIQDKKQMKQSLYKLYGDKTPGNQIFKSRLAKSEAPDRRKPSSSSSFIIGENLFSGSSIRPNVAIAPTYNVSAAIGGPDYSGKALMTMDGLVRPFSTSPTNYWNLPHFETPTASGSSGRSVVELNPFQTGHDIHTVAQGSGIPDEIHLSDMNDEWKRPLGLRAPLVLVGWGYDTAGKPVPNQNPTTPTDVFASGHLTRSDLWKAGPLDVKWNNTRKVWVTGGGSLNIARLDAFLLSGGNAIATIQNIEVSGASLIRTNGANITVYDMLVPSSYGTAIAPSGAYVYVQTELTSGRYTITGVGGF